MGLRNVLDFLASLRVDEFAKILYDENLLLTHGVIWNELGRNYRCFRQQGIEVNIYDLLDRSTDDDQVTLLTLLDHSNIIRNMSHQLCSVRVVDMDQVPSICFAEDVRGC